MLEGMLENFRLRVFRAVAAHLSFRKAAEQLYLTQPAITLQIKTLEDEMGARLFERRATGVTLTEAGKSLLPYAVQLARMAEEAENTLAQLKGEASGELALGASTTIAQYVLPSHLAGFARRFPSIHLRVSSENTERIVEGVVSGRFGLGLIEGPSRSREVKVERWFADELVIVVPKSHEWASLSSIPAASLVGVPLLMRERGSGSRRVIEQGLQKAGLRLNHLTIAMELDSTEAILSCIEAGLGIGFASVWAVDRRGLDRTFAKIHVEKHLLTRNFSFALPVAPNLSTPAAAMKRFLEQTMMER
jgi:DNA-binding transcriptional LysR family regulator